MLFKLHDKMYFVKVLKHNATICGKKLII